MTERNDMSALERLRRAADEEYIDECCGCYIPDPDGDPLCCYHPVQICSVDRDDLKIALDRIAELEHKLRVANDALRLVCATKADPIVRPTHEWGHAKLISELKDALNDLLGCGEEACNLVHHAKKDRHSISEPCPVLKRYRELLNKRF